VRQRVGEGLAIDFLTQIDRAIDLNSSESEKMVPQTQEPKEKKETKMGSPISSGARITASDFEKFALSHRKVSRGGGGRPAKIALWMDYVSKLRTKSQLRSHLAHIVHEEPEKRTRTTVEELEVACVQNT